MQLVQQFLIQEFLTRQRTFPGSEHLVLELFELRRDIALCRLQRLAPNVLDRCFLGLQFRDFDVIAVYTVVAEFERCDTGALTLARLQVHEVLVGVFSDRPQVIEFVVITACDHAAIANQHWWVIDNGFFEQAILRFVIANLCRKLCEQGRLDAREAVLQGRQSPQCLAQRAQIAGTRRSQRDARQDALDITDTVELRLQILRCAARRHSIDCLVARFQNRPVAQRTLNPAAQQAAAHRCLAVVHDTGQGVLVMTAQGLLELKVAAGGTIHDDGVVAQLCLDRHEVR